MSNQKAPYVHLDGSPCWTKNCSRNKAIAPKFVVPEFYHPEAFPKSAPPPANAWSDEDTVLFRTPHGSTLYGLSHAGSDEDWYVVNPSPTVSRFYRATQRIRGDKDEVAMPFKNFIKAAQAGVPQALEAMFSRLAVSNFFEDYRQNWYASDPAVIHTYMRTIKRFSLAETERLKPKDMFKRKRHSLRLAINLEELLYRGRFNPTLDQLTAERITRLAVKPGNQFITELKAISPIEIDWEYGQDNKGEKPL